VDVVCGLLERDGVTAHSTPAVVVSPSSISKRNFIISVLLLLLEIISVYRPLGWFETSGNTHPATQCHILKEEISHYIPVVICNRDAVCLLQGRNSVIK